ncbi:MAG: recombinase family protein [Acidimicrobiales bacterium]
MPTAAAIYARLSKDDKGDQLGVRRQERDCRALAERKGWAVASVYVDDDVSAYVVGKRPEYARLLADMKDGLVDALLVYDLDRLHRHPWELEEFFRTCDAANVTELASVGGDLDLATNDGRLMARIMGAVAKKSSDDAARRLQRKHLELAEAGMPSGGGARAFGYERDGVTVVDHEAAMIRDAAGRLLAGESMSSICRGWNETGQLTGAGSPWRASTLRNMLLSPRLAGLRSYRGDVVGGAAWPAVLERDTWEKVLAMLTDPSRRQERPGRASLLYGLIYCGRCGAKLTVAPVSGRNAYRCTKAPGRPSCNGISIVSTATETLIVDAVLRLFDSPEFAEALARGDAPNDDDGAAGEITAAQSRLAELAEMWAGGEITRAEWMTARRSLESAVEAAQRRVSRRRPTTALDGVDGPGALRSAWTELPVSRQRAVLAAIIDRIVIGPARRGYNKFDPARVDVVWRA